MKKDLNHSTIFIKTVGRKKKTKIMTLYYNHTTATRQEYKKN